MSDHTLKKKLDVALSMDVPEELANYTSRLFAGIDELGVLPDQVQMLLGTSLGNADAKSSRQVTIVDLGAGKGSYTFSVLERFPHTRALLVELDPTFADGMRKEATLRGLDDRAEVVCCDLVEFQPKDRFDIALCFSLGELLGSFEEKASFLAGLLTPNGLFATDEATLRDAMDADIELSTQEEFLARVKMLPVELVNEVPVDTESYRVWLEGAGRVLLENTKSLAAAFPDDAAALLEFGQSQIADFENSEELLVETHLYLLRLV